MKLHIFLGGKGGTGKTLLALAKTLHSIKNLKSSLVIDLNYNNADLAELLRPLVKSAEDRPLNNTDFTINKFTYKSGPIVETNNYLVFPEPTGNFFGKIPLGMAGIYQTLETILANFSNDYQGVNEIIVDTALHLSALFPIDKQHSISAENLPNLFNCEVCLWFNWTIATARRTSEVASAQKALTWLQDINMVKLPQNLIHVINPYIITQPIPFLNMWPKDNITIDSLHEFLNQTNIGSPIDFRLFANLIHQAIHEYVGDDREIFLNRIVQGIRYRASKEVLFRHGSRQREGGDRPRNVFPIPYFRRTLTGYTDSLENTPDIIDNLVNRLGNIYDALDYFLDKRG